MADFDIVELRERYKLVCQGFPAIPSDLKREYEEEDEAKELRDLLNNAATIMGGLAYNIIEEATFKSSTLIGLNAQLDLFKTRLSTCESTFLEFEHSRVLLTDDRVAHLKAHVEDKYALYRDWVRFLHYDNCLCVIQYDQDAPLRELKRDMLRLQHPFRQHLDSLHQKISNNSSLIIQINQLVDQMSKHMETWPTEDLRTKVKGYDYVSQSLHTDKNRLNELQESLERLITDVIGLIDRLLDIKKEYDVKLFRIYTIRKEDFHELDAYLFGPRAPKSPQASKFFLEVTKLVPINKLVLLLAAKPISDITIVECRDHIQFAYLKTAEEGDILVTEDQWVKIMGPVKNQLEHDICWAFVTAELVSAVRHIYKYDPTVVEYSCRDLVDFVDHQKRSQEKTKEKSGNKHFCYAHGLRQGFEYVKVNGILREESRPFEADCREEVVTRHGSNLGYIKEVVSLTTVKEVLQTLQNHPVAGCIPVFEPDYGSINDQLYYGPTSPLSRYETMHAISFVGAGGVKEGEKHVNARSSHGVNFGKDGYFKICFQHVIICLTRGHHMRYLEDPVLLPCRFVYPELLSQEKDKEKRRDDTI
ncbi:uncharacterized protein LOC103853010 isoform X1 [Brassica rapa]|uniref:uncharacterized protein LOC103853010 isoform X1 n=2 Tax=Brassica campestris TaxID=3711 RepID=UPI0004F1B3F4|nr:uncharacterized protein LOC103853010 isoform X1 [Brassica rapa]